jgi:hypothetical protein
MDGSSFDSEDTFQICSIIDYYMGSENILKPISSEIMNLVTTYNESDNCKFNYVYDKEQKKARFVLWGSAEFMENVMKILKNYDT